MRAAIVAIVLSGCGAKYATLEAIGRDGGIYVAWRIRCNGDSRGLTLMTPRTVPAGEHIKIVVTDSECDWLPATDLSGFMPQSAR